MSNSSLFNDYGAANTDDARILDRKVQEFVDIMLMSFKEYPTHEVEHIILTTTTAVCANERLKRALAKRKAEREQKRD